MEALNITHTNKHIAGLFFAGACVVIVGFAYAFLLPQGMTVFQPIGYASPFTPQESKQLQGNIAVSAVAASTVDVAGCKQDPVAAKAVSGSSLEFVNTDLVSRTLRFNSTASTAYVIPAKGKLSIRFDFWKSPGLRSYFCDGEASSGYILITQKPQ